VQDVRRSHEPAVTNLGDASRRGHLHDRAMTTLRRPSRLPLARREVAVWRSGDVPMREAGAELVEGEDQAVVRSNGHTVHLDRLGVLVWPLLDGTRSAPALARLVAEREDALVLDTAVAVHAVLEELAAIGAVRWV